MQFPRKRLASALALVLGAGGSLLAGMPVQAQDIRVEVTGSSIRRVEAEGALPIQVVTRTEIEQTGARSIPELIQSLPAFQGFTTQGDSVGGGGAGFAGAGLHNQGETRTLVLLNGKRMAPSGTQALTGAQAAVNINNIPLVAIERVEILLDGASSVYGADAIGGVVNFITARNVDYASLGAGGSWPDGNEGTDTTFSAVVGYGTLEKEGFNVMIAASRFDRDPLKATDRAYAKSGLFNFYEGGREYQFQLGSPSPIPANLTVGSALITPYLSANGKCANQTFFLDGACYYDFTQELEIYPEQKSDNVYASFTKKLGDHQFSVDYIYSQTKTTSRLAPPPGSFTINSTSTLWPEVLRAIEAEGLQVPSNNRVTARYRVADVGKRTTEDVSTANHVTAELKGVLWNWDYSASYTRSTAEYESNLKGGWVQLNPFLAALGSGLVDPFVGPGQQSPAAQELLNASIINGYFDGGKTTLDYAEIKGARGIFKAPGGEVQLALGGSYLKEKFDSQPSQLAQGFDANGNPDTRFGDTSAIIPYDASRTSYAGFAEMLIPIVKGLEFSPSVRFDDYEDFGSQVTYKLPLRYQPIRELLFRGSYGTGFKAPTVPQINASSQSFGVTGGTYSCNSDPRLQAQADRLNALCPAGGAPAQYDVIAAGNKALEPEESEQWTIGVRWEPNKYFSGGVDLWNINIDNTIGQIGEDTVFTNPGQYPSSFTTFVDPATGETLLALFAGNVNLGKSETQGLDIDLAARADITGGSVRSQLLATYLIKNEYEVVPGEGFFNDIGKFINGAPSFRWKAKWINTVDLGSWSHTLAFNYLSGYEDDPTEVLDVAANEFVTLNRKVDYNFTVDWQSRWRFNKQLDLTVGVINLFNQDPPLSITLQRWRSDGRLRRALRGFARSHDLREPELPVRLARARIEEVNRPLPSAPTLASTPAAGPTTRSCVRQPRFARGFSLGGGRRSRREAGQCLAAPASAATGDPVFASSRKATPPRAQVANMAAKSARFEIVDVIPRPGFP